MGIDRGKCEIYKDREGKWRWRAIARNGQIVAASHQGYVNKADCIKNAKAQGYIDCN